MAITLTDSNVTEVAELIKKLPKCDRYFDLPTDIVSTRKRSNVIPVPLWDDTPETELPFVSVYSAETLEKLGYTWEQAPVILFLELSDVRDVTLGEIFEAINVICNEDDSAILIGQAYPRLSELAAFGYVDSSENFTGFYNSELPSPASVALWKHVVPTFSDPQNRDYAIVGRSGETVIPWFSWAVTSKNISEVEEDAKRRADVLDVTYVGAIPSECLPAN